MSKRLRRLMDHGRTIRSIGFDDAPFERGRRYANITGVICKATRFEGMVWGRVTQDGWNATREVVRLLETGKFLPQLHLVLLDGIAFGGFNIVDLPQLHAELGIPCVAVMRKQPDMRAIRHALQHLSKPEKRWDLIQQAGEIYQTGGCCFQVTGAEPDVIAELLPQLTHAGHIPEPIRMAHLIGSAVKTGESGKRA